MTMPDRAWGMRTLGTVPPEVLGPAQRACVATVFKDKAHIPIIGQHWYVQSYVNWHWIDNKKVLAQPSPEFAKLLDWFLQTYNQRNWLVADYKIIEVADKVRLHIDHHLWHRISDRYIIDVLNIEGSMRYFLHNGLQHEGASYDGHVFQFNNDIPHYSRCTPASRYSFIIDMMDPRLVDKFMTRNSENWSEGMLMTGDPDIYVKAKWPQIYAS